MKIIYKMAIAAVLATNIAAVANAERLVILHTNDTHSQIDPLADGMGGVARRKVLVDSVRAANKNVLLIDAGDVVQGTLFFNLYKGEVEEKLMNALEYDIRILGNHEFDNGMQALAKNLSTAEAELLASNYQMRGTELDGLFKPYTIHEIDGKRIAFIPINLEPKGMIAENNYKGMGYVDALATANNMAWYLKNIGQADYIVAITHIGYDPAEGPGDVDLARASKDIDLIIGGHSHTVINPADANTPAHIFKNADGRDVLIAQTGRSGANLGEITIDLDSLDKLPVSRLISVDSRLDSRLDGTIESIVEPYRKAVDELNSTPVAKIPRTLERNSAEILNWVSDLVAEEGRRISPDGHVDFSVYNKGSIRNTLTKGDVSEGQIITLLPFFNRIEVIDIKGDKLIETFDIMAKVGGNGVSSEVEAVFDPDTRKCTSITYKGKPLDPDATYRIATIDYVANGGDYMTPMRSHTDVATSENLLFEDVLAHLRRAGKKAVIKSTDRPRMYPLKK